MLRPNFGPDRSCPLNRKYEVIVGHTRVHVVGATRQEAIASARRQLCADMPQMWDVIQGLSPQRFAVREVAE